MKTQYRRAPANARFSRMDSGSLVKLRADDLGVVEVTTEAQRRVADAFGLHVTRTPRLANAEVDQLKKEQ